MSGVQASNPFGVAFGASSIQGLIEKKDRRTDRTSGDSQPAATPLNGNSTGATFAVNA